MTTPNPSSENVLERLFKLSENKTTFRTEVLAGVTTFLTMCYIIIVNPMILSETGMDHGAVFVATCLAAAIGCLVMGIIANYPIALAPGMGLNAYFTYSVCMGMGVPWQTALAAVFVSGLVFIAISNPATLVGLGDLKQPTVLLTLFGFLMIVVLHQFKVRGSIIISILVLTAISTVMGLSEFKGVVGEIPSIAPTFLQMDFEGLFTASLVGVIFVFFLVDLFDSTGTLVGVAHRAGGKLPRLKKALFADSTAIVAGAALGTSSTTPYIESSAGVAAGGRTGLTAVVVGVLFILCLFLAPLAQSVPGFATAPALLFVGVLMIQGITHIEWDDITEAVPAFLTIVFMPFSYSIADGIAMGFISYALIKLCTGKASTVPYMVWIVAVLWAIKFAFFGG